MKLIANGTESLSYCIGKIRSEFKREKYLRISVVSGKHRSIRFNALSHAWYKQISDERGEFTPGEVHAFCKLHFGVPILRRDDEEFCRVYDASLKPLEYNQKMMAVALISVSSCFTNKQFKEYMEEVQRHFAGLETDPVFLEFPDEN